MSSINAFKSLRTSVSVLKCLGDKEWCSARLSCQRSEQPGYSGVGGKSAEWGERGSPSLYAPHSAFLPQTGEKPLPHSPTGTSYVSAGMKLYFSLQLQSQSPPYCTSRWPEIH